MLVSGAAGLQGDFPAMKIITAAMIPVATPASTSCKMRSLDIPSSFSSVSKAFSRGGESDTLGA